MQFLQSFSLTSEPPLHSHNLKPKQNRKRKEAKSDSYIKKQAEHADSGSRKRQYEARGNGVRGNRTVAGGGDDDIVVGIRVRIWRECSTEDGTAKCFSLL